MASASYSVALKKRTAVGRSAPSAAATRGRKSSSAIAFACSSAICTCDGRQYRLLLLSAVCATSRRHAATVGGGEGRTLEGGGSCSNDIDHPSVEAPISRRLDYPLFPVHFWRRGGTAGCWSTQNKTTAPSSLYLAVAVPVFDLAVRPRRRRVREHEELVVGERPPDALADVRRCGLERVDLGDAGTSRSDGRGRRRARR